MPTSKIIDYSTYTDRQLVDIAVYVASLATDTDEIDNYVDVIRVTTSRYDLSKTGIPAKERGRLVSIIEDIIDYLIHDDPARAFTKESILERITMFTEPRPKKLIKLSAIYLLSIIGVATAVASLALAVPSGFELTAKLQLSLMLFLFIAHLGGAFLLATALQNFKSSVLAGFKLLVVSIALVALNNSQFFLYETLGIDIGAWNTYGGSLLLLAPAVFVGVIGVMMIARALKIKSWLSKTSNHVTLTTVMVFAILALPHASIEHPVEFTLTIGPATYVAVATIWMGVLLIKIGRHIPILYSSALRILGSAYVIVGLTTSVNILVVLIKGYMPAGVMTVLFLPFLVTEFQILWGTFLLNKRSNEEIQA